MDPLLFDVGVKGLVVLGLATVAARLLREEAAATRHLVWSIALASLVALPLFAVALPAWRIEVLPGGAAATAAAASGRAPAGVPWARMGVLAWLAGAAVVGAATVLGRACVWRLARGSEPLTSGPWPALANRISGEIGLSRGVRVRMVDREIMPMVWGVFRPVVLLPRSAEEWSGSLRRHVLLHELAHVRRHDYPVQLVCRLALAIHWFDPLAWSAARRLRLERERACDDHVLDTGASACDYAKDLVEMARRLGPARRSALALGAVGASSFADRVMALLDGGRRRRVMTRRIVLGGGGLAAGLVLPLAVVHPTPRAVPRVAAHVQPIPPPGPTPTANALWAIEAEAARGEPKPSTAPRPAPGARPRGSTPAETKPATRAVQIVHVDPIEVVVPVDGAESHPRVLNAARAIPRPVGARIDQWSPAGPGEKPDERASTPTKASETCQDGDRDAPSHPDQLASTTLEAATF